MTEEPSEAIPVWTTRLSENGKVLSADVPGDFPLLNGAEPEQGMAVSQFLSEELAALVDSSLRSVRSTGRMQTFEHEPNGSSGSKYEGRLVPVENDELLLILQDVTSQRRAEAALIRSREQLRSLAGHVESVREEERKRIAREVHDVLGQSLTALRIDVASVQKSLTEDQEDLYDRLGLLAASIGSIIQKVRRIAADLRPGVLDDLGIVAALEWQTEEFQQRTDIACSFNSHVNHLDLDADRSTALFRVYQEVLTNVVRHADASAVQVTLRYRNDELVLSVKDNGRGIREKEIADIRSLGLVGMRERLLPWQGTISFEGLPDLGTTVTIVLPFLESPA